MTVRLFELLAPRRLRVLNLGASPVPTSGGYLGPGASLDLRPQEWVGAGLLEIQAPEWGLIRRLRAELSCRAGPGGSLRLTARLARREYVAGVSMAELPGDSSAHHTELGAAVLRFLGRGARHAGADVCDTTHCAWFVGRGPHLDWTEPRRALPLPGPAGAPDLTLGDAEWARILEAARRPGPSQWTSHCGGRPLSSHAVWGTGDSSAIPCPRHGAAETRPWARLWSAKDVEKAFGASVRAMSVEDEDGVWVMRVEAPEGTRAWRYDEAHRRLARVLGWGSLPSPAERIEAVPAGFRAQGVGLGHRVGLCLAD
ncbi:MAG TPA: hypothetical protein VJU18_04590 [Vicinamibacteria bacterium]|nr:hypothetical protein [Vicinamibacteria bacterium]